MSTFLVRPGQKIAFLGASITQFGWEQPGGFIRLIVDHLAQHGIPVTPIPSGVSGNTSREIRARLEQDVLRYQPDWVVIDAGRNDVWHGTIPFDAYMDNMTAIVNQAQAAGVQVVLQTITPIGEDLDNDFNRQLAYSNHFVRYLARQKKCLVSDLSARFHDALRAKQTSENLLTTDGVHLNDAGNQLLATGLLHTFGDVDDV